VKDIQVTEDSSRRKPTKRANGEGTIFREPKRNRYVCDIWVPPAPGRTGYRKRFTARTRTEVIAKRDEFKRELARGLLPSRSRVTLSEFGERHFTVTLVDLVAVGRLRQSTLENYRVIWNTHIAPTLGESRLVNLTPTVLQHWLAELTRTKSARTGRPLSTRTQEAAYQLLRALLNQAIREHLLDRNPLGPTGVRAPRGMKKRVKHIDSDDLDKLLSHLASHNPRLHALVVLMFGCGSRPGEALGARWDDLDLDASSWHITGTLQRRRIDPASPSSLQRGPTKTEESNAEVTLPTVVVRVLRKHAAAQAEARLKAGDKWQDYGYVFSTRHGKPLAASNVLREFKKEALAAGITTPMTLHMLRHSTATALLEDGVPATTAMRVLRHKQLATTTDLYGHVTPRIRQEAADAMDARFNRMHGA
jgi:integrase